MKILKNQHKDFAGFTEQVIEEIRPVIEDDSIMAVEIELKDGFVLKVTANENEAGVICYYYHGYSEE